MIQELLDFADVLELKTPAPFERRPVPFIIDLDLDGKVLWISRTNQHYRHAGWRKLHVGLFLYLRKQKMMTPAHRALLRFLCRRQTFAEMLAFLDLPPDAAKLTTDHSTALKDIGDKNFGFRVAGKLLHSDDAVREWWDRLYREDDTDKKEDRNGYDIFIREGAVLQELFDPDTKKADALAIEKLAKEIFVNELGHKIAAWTAKEAKKGKGKKGTSKAAEPATADEGAAQEAQEEDSAEAEEVSPAKQAKQRAFQLAVMRTFFDLRAFGGVLSTKGPLRGSFYGQIRGPLQFTFSESLDKVLPLDATITRCAVASVDEAKKQAAADSGDSRMMGRKYGIDYGLYRCHIHFSPAFAAKTRFTYYDLDNFLFALVHMFDDDHAAGRHLRLVGLVDFQHQSALGNAPAHRLFNLVAVRSRTKTKDGKPVFRSSDSEFPRSLDDYEGTPPADEYHVTKTGEIRAGKNGEGAAVIKANSIVWEIPLEQTDAKTS